MRPFRHESNRSRNYVENDSPLYNAELQDLDMELEILKRQREIIRQKQRETLNLTQRQGNYQPSSSYGRQEPNLQRNIDTNFSTNYNLSKHSNIKKRPAERSLQGPSAPKQSNRTIHPWDNHYNNQAPKPLLSFQMEPFRPRAEQKNKIFPNSAPKSRPELRSGKITPRSRSRRNPPNKLHTYTPQEAKQLVSETCKSTKVSVPTEILRPKVEPSPQLKGRLELALGQIMKMLKESKVIDEDIQERLKTQSVQRAIKTVVRTRISKLMMNKVVGPYSDIIACYRKNFPNDVDEEMIKVVKAVNQPLTKTVRIRPLSAQETEDIRVFFKNRLTFTLKTKFQEMIGYLVKIYGNNEEDILKFIDELPSIEELTACSDKDQSLDSIKKEDIEPTKEKIEATKDKEESTDMFQGNKDNVEKSSQCTVEEVEAEQKKVEVQKKIHSEKLEFYYKVMDTLILNRLPKILYKFKEDLVDMVYSDKDFLVAKEQAMVEVKDHFKKALLSVSVVEDEGKTKPNWNDHKGKTINDDNKTKTSLNDDKGETINDDSKTKASLNNDKGNTINDDSKTKTSLLDGKDNTVINDDREKNIDGEQTLSQNSSPLFVMLLARPNLPPKPIIYKFLNNFHPVSIKKHKTVNNLLVIGFKNKEDYNKILAANESKVGDATFIIKANDVVGLEKQIPETQQNQSNNVEEEKTLLSDSEINKSLPLENEVEKCSINEEQELLLINVEGTDLDKCVKIDDVNDSVEGGDAEDSAEGIIIKDSVTEISANDTNQRAMETVLEIDDDDIQIVEPSDNVTQVENATIVKNLKESAPATPTRSSSRLSNIRPSTIQTRRTSKLVSNN